jgi:hypothetical protein
VVAALMFCLVLQGQQVVVQGGPPPKPVPRDAPSTLPDTPQARMVREYLDAFNSGNETRFMKAQEDLMSAETLAKRPADQRAKMYARMKADFGTLTIKRVAATPEQIRAVVPDKDGNEAIIAFDFEPKSPHKIKSISIDISGVQR